MADTVAVRFTDPADGYGDVLFSLDLDDDEADREGWTAEVLAALDDPALSRHRLLVLHGSPRHGLDVLTTLVQRA